MTTIILRTSIRPSEPHSYVSISTHRRASLRPDMAALGPILHQFSTFLPLPTASHLYDTLRYVRDGLTHAVDAGDRPDIPRMILLWRPWGVGKTVHLRNAAQVSINSAECLGQPHHLGQTKEFLLRTKVIVTTEQPRSFRPYDATSVFRIRSVID